MASKTNSASEISSGIAKLIDAIQLTKTISESEARALGYFSIRDINQHEKSKISLTTIRSKLKKAAEEGLVESISVKQGGTIAKFYRNKEKK